jgi:hypothetical protein
MTSTIVASYQVNYSNKKVIIHHLTSTPILPTKVLVVEARGYIYNFFFGI